MAGVRIYHQQDTLTRWSLAIDINLFYLDNSTDILLLNNNIDRPYLDKYNNKSGTTIWQ